MGSFYSKSQCQSSCGCGTQPVRPACPSLLCRVCGDGQTIPPKGEGDDFFTVGERIEEQLPGDEHY